MDFGKCILIISTYTFKNLVPFNIYIYIYMWVWVWVCVCKEKLKIQEFEEFIMKVYVERFGCNNLLQNFKFMKNV